MRRWDGFCGYFVTTQVSIAWPEGGNVKGSLSQSRQEAKDAKNEGGVMEYWNDGMWRDPELTTGYTDGQEVIHRDCDRDPDRKINDLENCRRGFIPRLQ